MGTMAATTTTMTTTEADADAAQDSTGWCPIPDFPGYEFALPGQVRSYWTRGVKSRIDSTPRLMMPRVHNSGQHTWYLYRNRQRVCCTNRSLIVACFGEDVAPPKRKPGTKPGAAPGTRGLATLRKIARRNGGACAIDGHRVVVDAANGLHVEPLAGGPS